MESKTVEYKQMIKWGIIILFVLLLIGGIWLRTLNISFLKDETTGKHLPLALDPFYFLRISRTLVSGGLPDYDAMRYPSLNVGFSHEVMPKIVALMWRVNSIFNKNVTLEYINVISPVIFFALGLVVFFFLIYLLTKSKTTALVSCIFLTVIPMYLYRTMAGFSDHESIGMVGFFLVFLCYALALNFMNKQRNSGNTLKFVLYALLVAFVSAFSVASWGGGARFIFMIIPLSFVLFWFIKFQNLKEDIGSFSKKVLNNFILFYLIWFVFTILFSMLYGYTFSDMLGKYVLSSGSMLALGMLLFLIVDYVLILLIKKEIIKDIRIRKFRAFASIILGAVVGAIFFTFVMGNIFSLIASIISGLLSPFGIGRIGLTVAENKQPYLMDWMGQMGKSFFWIFVTGMVIVGVELSKMIKKNKNKILFSLFWIIMIFGVLFSRVSSSSILNGSNFISKFIYFGSLILFIGFGFWVYFKDRIKPRPALLIIGSWLFFMLISGRGALRLLFVITPFVCFMAGFAVVGLFNYAKRSKNEILKIIFWIGFGLVVILLIMSFFSFYNSSKQQAKSTGPSANIHWQKAMSWVRENTQEGEIFVHWWDYGYWVQYLGERPTITDGGHANGFWDHLIGRYVLTTPKPETALSFMKAHDVSYLLIDPTDIGKYGAYSSIGSDESGNDRLSWIPIMQSDPSQFQETADGMLRVYSGGIATDEDIVYEYEGTKIFLPAQKSAVGGVIFVVGEDSTLEQPYGIFYYNGKQIRIPLRYAYYNEKLIDFEDGLDVAVYILTTIEEGGQGIQIDNFGALIYLSPKVFRGLVAQLYLMDDPFNRFEGFKLTHSEPNPVVDNLNSQGANVNEFVYYRGLQGPIKIWKADYPENIIAREEFLRVDGGYGEFDGLEFLK